MEMGNLPYNLNDEASDDIDDDTVTEVPLESGDPGAQELLENEDGSVDVIFKDEETPPEQTEFMANLAEALPEQAIEALGRDLIKLVEEDIRAYERRDKQYADGVKRTGTGEKAPGGAEFDGASVVTHPMLIKGCIDFASRAVKELFPANGPCRTQIIGEQSEAKLDKAERKKKFMNWQMTRQIIEQRDELEKLLSQVPISGVQYKRWWWDHDLNRPRTETFYNDNVFMASNATSFYTSQRTTYRQKIIRQVFDQRVRNGLYRDIPVTDTALMLNETSRTETATNKVEGVDPEESVYNEDGLRVVYQIEVMLELEDDQFVDGRTAPYIVHLDHATEKVLGLYRNWADDDENYRKLPWATEWPFLVWRGGQPIGLYHIIGSMAGAATGALRAILDAGHIANFPGGLMLNGGKTPGESVQVSATQLAKIDPPMGTTDPDIRKLVMGFPFPGPSQVLFNVLEFLTQYAEGVIQTASDKIADAGPDMPVGTAMALIEHGATNFSAIHARLHYAMGRDLEILHRLNAQNLDDEEVIEELGELIVRRDDFKGPMDIVPTSDPNIFSETQRYAQMQAVIQLQAMPIFTQFFKPEQLLRRALKLLQIDDPSSVANLPNEPKKLGPIDENYVISSADDNAPLKVYEEQDDVAHLKAHIQYATSPMFGANPLIASKIMPGMLQHCKEHILALYKKHTKAATEAVRVALQMQGLADVPEDEVHLQGAAFAEQMLASLLGPMIMPGLQQMQQIVEQIMQSQAPKPSPDVKLVQDTFKEVELKKLELKQQELKAKAEDSERDRQNEQGLAQLATNVELIRDQQKEAGQQLRDQFQAQHEAQMTVLTTVLTEALKEVTVNNVGPDGELVQEKVSSGLAEQLLGPLTVGLQQALAVTLNQASGEASQLAILVQNLMMNQENLAQILQGQQQTNQQAFQQLGAAVQQLSAQLQPPQPGPGPQGQPPGASQAQPGPGPQQPMPGGQ